MRIGIGLRRSVRGFHGYRCQPLIYPSAEGNPDEEKIGAFGVGGSTSHLILKPSYFLNTVSTGFYSLFSVTEEPWVTSGGTQTLLY
jgi:hypothetical protein